MRFVFLTDREVEAAQIEWRDDVTKGDDLVHAAMAAGFSHDEAVDSPIGVVVEDFSPVADVTFRKGARVLVGINGSTLVELISRE